MTKNTVAMPRSAPAAADLRPQYRARLEEQWRHQLGDIIDLSNDSRSASDEPDEDGLRETDQILSARLLAAARMQLDETEAALARLDDGSYGSCGICAEPISSERLEILPAASYCVVCQSRRTGG
jgi:DnaK suppressor protein